MGTRVTVGKVQQQAAPEDLDGSMEGIGRNG